MIARLVTIAEHQDTPHGRCGCGRFGTARWTGLLARAGFASYLVGCRSHVAAAFDEIERNFAEDAA